jgi:serine/threonine protein kinase
VSERVGRFRVIQPLGAGGMGRVFLAESTAAGGFARRVVLKQVSDPGDEELRTGLLAEARLQAKLVHRNIVPVLDLEEHEGQHYIVLEHVDGIDLRRLLKRVGTLPWRIVVYIGMEVAAALDYAHRRVGPDGAPLGLVHRDVTPANILCSWEGEIRLTDFGIARSGPHQAEGLIGNLAYIAPEHAAAEPVDARGDLYSLGLVMYEALSGSNPFNRKEDDDTVAAVKANVFSPLGPESAPDKVRAIIERCMARNPSARYDSAAKLREDLVAVPDRLPDPVVEFANYLGSKRPRSEGEKDALRRLINAGRALTQRLGLTGRVSANFAGDTVADVAPPRRRPWAWGVVFLVTASALAITVARRKPVTPPPLLATPAPTAAPTPTPTPTPPTEPTVQIEPTAIDIPIHVAPKKGSLSINSIPWSNVWLDEHALGHTPRMHVSVSAGKHRVRLRNQAGDERLRVVEVRPGQDLKLSVVFSEP